MSNCTIPGKPHRAEVGLFVCRHHLDEIGEWLWDVQREAELLDANPSMQSDLNRTRGGGLASHRSPARLEAIVARDRRRVSYDELTGLAGVDDTLSVYAVLHGYAAMVRVGRNIGVPTRTVVRRLEGWSGPLCDTCQHRSCRYLQYRHIVAVPLTVASERQILSRHLDWAAGQPWIDDLWADLRKLRGQLQNVNGTSDPKPIPGRCPRLAAGTVATECGGHLWPVRPKHTSGEPVPDDAIVRAIECELNADHYWDGVHLGRLLLILDQQREAS